jgi:hypothetical protein
LVEAGHRCAIPSCRATTTEIAHIIPWAETKDNSFENLIALCPNCHTRYDQKKEIDHRSIQMYKGNLKLKAQKFAENYFLGDQNSELEINFDPIMTIHSWMFDCTIENILLKTGANNGPYIASTILDILVDQESVFDGNLLTIDYGSDTSCTSKNPYNLLNRYWCAGSKVEFRFIQIGGGKGYQLLLSGYHH